MGEVSDLSSRQKERMVVESLGFDPEEVRIFLDMVADEYERGYQGRLAECDDLRARVTGRLAACKQGSQLLQRRCW